MAYMKTKDSKDTVKKEPFFTAGWTMSGSESTLNRWRFLKKFKIKSKLYTAVLELFLAQLPDNLDRRARPLSTSLDGGELLPGEPAFSHY